MQLSTPDRPPSAATKEMVRKKVQTVASADWMAPSVVTRQRHSADCTAVLEARRKRILYYCEQQMIVCAALL